MDYAGPQSLFLVVSYEHEAPCFSRILQLQLGTTRKQVKKIRVTEKDYVRSFSKPKDCPFSKCLFSPPTSSTEYNMYIVPDYDYPPYPICNPLQGIKLNFSTGECLQIKSPWATKYHGHAVTCRGLIYFMARPDLYYHTPDPVFECYDPDENKWKALQPFPLHNIYLKDCCIVATVVLDDTIIYNLSSCEMWAYNVPLDKWYIVRVQNHRCYGIQGEAVVLGDTIYALPGYLSKIEPPNLVLALSIKRKKIKDDLVYICYLRSLIFVEGLEDFKCEDEDEAALVSRKSRHLVYLGGYNFCVVQSCEFSRSFIRYQPIHLTRIMFTGKTSMTVTDVNLYEVDSLHKPQFQVRLCFSLPEWKTAALEDGKGFTIPIDPGAIVPAPTEFGKSVQAPTRGDGAVPRSRNTDAEGHSVKIRKFPPDVTFKQFAETMLKFGPIKVDGVRVRKHKNGICCSASVKFEGASSQQSAIKASPIVVGVRQVEVNEMITSIAVLNAYLCKWSSDSPLWLPVAFGKQ